METKHTPAPWKLGLYDASHNYQHIKTHVAVCREDGGLLATCGPQGDSESEADAAFIVRAVNCHEELIECLKRLLADSECYCNNDRSVGLLYTCPIHEAEQAIAKAEGGKTR